MKAEAAPRLMRGEVEPPVGPPRAHSLGDEKEIPVAERVPALNRTCLIWGRMKTQGHIGRACCCRSGSKQHTAGAPLNGRVLD